MEDNNIPYLCGGTFFFLLAQARPRKNSREKLKGEKNVFSDSEIMQGLLHAIIGNDMQVGKGTLKKDTSHFRECLIDGSSAILFNDRATEIAYSNAVKNNYKDILSQMNIFAEKFIGQSVKSDSFIHSLLEVINLDPNIPDDMEFYVNSDGSTLTKAQLRDVQQIEIQPFLVGVVHFILVHRKDNKSGYATLEAWGEKKNNKERKLKDDFSLGEKNKTKVIWHKFHNNKNSGGVGSEQGDSVSYIKAVQKSEENNEDNNKTQESDKEIQSVEQHKINPAVTEVNVEGNDSTFINNINNYDAPKKTINFFNVSNTNNYGMGDIPTEIEPDYHCYNLFVLDDENYCGGSFVVRKEQVSIENTPEELRSQCFSFTPEAIKKIKSYPAIFANLNHNDKNASEEQKAYFGYVYRVEVLNEGFRISYYCIDAFSQQLLNKNCSAFGLEDAWSTNELNNIEWSIKKINVVDVLHNLGIKIRILTY